MTISRRSIPEVHLPGLGTRVPAEQWTREAEEREGFREALMEASDAKTGKAGKTRADREAQAGGAKLIQLRTSDGAVSPDEAEAALAAAMLLSGGAPADATAKTLKLLRKATALGRQRLGALRAGRARRGQANNLGAAIERLKAASDGRRAPDVTRGGARMNPSASPAEAALGRMLAAVTRPAADGAAADWAAKFRAEAPQTETAAPADSRAATLRTPTAAGSETARRVLEQRMRMRNPGAARRQPGARVQGSRTRVSGRAADAPTLSPKVMRAIMTATARPEINAVGLMSGLASAVEPRLTQREAAPRRGSSPRDLRTPATAEDAAREITVELEGGPGGSPAPSNIPEVKASARATVVQGPAAASEAAQATVDRVLSQLDMAVLRAGRVRQSLDLALGDLGRVRVNLDLSGGQLKVVLVAADAQARGALDRSISGLVGGLVRRGYTEPVVQVKAADAEATDSGARDASTGQESEAHPGSVAREESEAREEIDARLAAIRRWTRDRQNGEGDR